MKKALRIICFFATTLLLSNNVFSQAFSVQHDTINYTYTNGSGNVNVQDDISVATGAANVVLKWSVVSTNFPADWISADGMCDNNLCYGLSLLWPSGTLKTSSAYSTGLGDFHLQLNMPSTATRGSYYVTVRMYNQADTLIANTIATETYVINGYPTGIPNIKTTQGISLFPNPTNNEATLSFNLTNSSDVQVSIVDQLGRTVNIIANETMTEGIHQLSINTNNLSTGIYNVVLHTEHGTFTERLSVLR